MCVSRVVYATCTNSIVTIYGTIQTKFRGEFCGTMLLQIGYGNIDDLTAGKCRNWMIVRTTVGS